MKVQDFKALIAHIEEQLQGFKRTYKLYDSVYTFKNSDKTLCLEFRFETSNLISAKLYEMIKDNECLTIDETLLKSSTYNLSAVQSVKILTLLESMK